MTENYLLTAHLTVVHFRSPLAGATSMDGRSFEVPMFLQPPPPPATFCTDCGDQRGQYSFVYGCAGCSEVRGFQTIHCARCLVQFHEAHITYPLFWPSSSSEELATRFLSFVKMSKEIKTTSSTTGTRCSPSPPSPPEFTLSDSLPDISSILPKRN
uniref:Nuclear receptor domain-containing protein n=1 Tax=Steinernema glaseri TaxID=37863 RepID=A0A1I7ZQX7_9BILA